MAQQSENPPAGKKYPLLVPRVLARRYRPVGVLLIVIGIMAQLPRLVPQLRAESALLDFETLSYVGIVALVAGAGLFIVSLLESRLAYVQCLPDYLLINTSSGRVACTYRRINTFKTAPVEVFFPTKGAKGRQKYILNALAKERVAGKYAIRALEMLVDEYPLPPKTIQRRVGKMMISPRDQAFLFIVRDAGGLEQEITSYMDLARQKLKGDDPNAFKDPFARIAAR